MHLPYTAPCDRISGARDHGRMNMTNLRRAFGSGLRKFLNRSCTSWHSVVVYVILSMAEEEDRCAHRVKARREQAHGLPSRSTTRARNEQASNKQARASHFDTTNTTLRPETLGNPFANHCSKSLSNKHAIVVNKHRLQTTHIICSHTPHDSAVLEARAPETLLRHSRL